MIRHDPTIEADGLLVTESTVYTMTMIDLMLTTKFTASQYFKQQKRIDMAFKALSSLIKKYRWELTGSLIYTIKIMRNGYGHFKGIRVLNTHNDEYSAEIILHKLSKYN